MDFTRKIGQEIIAVQIDRKQLDFYKWNSSRD